MSVVIDLAFEEKSFRSPRPAASAALHEAFRTELMELGRQVRERGEIEGAIRLRALAEIEASLSTHDLCRLAAEAG